MNSDFFVHELRFPNRSTPAMVFPNDDGSFDIYLNLLYSEELRRHALEHELRHIKDEHFYTDIPVARAERQAEDEPLNMVLHSPDDALPHFYSEESFAAWVRTLCKQVKVGI